MRRRQRVTLKESFQRANRATWDEFTPDPVTPWFVIVIAGIYYWVTGIPEPKNPPSQEG